MNMMNRMVDGRAHRREIDMLLELTYAVIHSFNTGPLILFTVNK